MENSAGWPHRFVTLSRRNACRVAGFLIVIFLCGCQDEPTPQVQPQPVNQKEETNQSSVSPPKRTVVQDIVSSEEFILRLTPKLGALNRAALNLKLRSPQTRHLFAKRINVADIARATSAQPLNSYLRTQNWPVLPAENQKDVWASFFDSVSFLESARFYLIDGQLSDDAHLLDSTLGFTCHFKTDAGLIGHAKAAVAVQWTVAATGSPEISRWHTIKFETTLAENQLFSDVSESAIGDQQLAHFLSRSVHENMTEMLIRGRPINPPADDKYRLFFPEVTLEHPSVSVVDFDNDGWDDIFLALIHRPSIMFRNMGDGTFQPWNQQLGFNLPNDCTCSLFADFDNDGDQDAFIGRARHRAVYLNMQDGKYIEPSNEGLKKLLPFMVSSISAADYDNDGLLDVYFSTYSPIEGSHANVKLQGARWPTFFLDDSQRAEFEKRKSLAHPYLDMAGPPNLLLKNNGKGNFSSPPVSSTVESWRKSFQSSWCDFDQDGDQDLYVCNDFAPDDLYRNDRDSFVRVSDAVGLDKLGFGMGVSWGDYNRDGHFDLYVSNMFSKAGTRITKQIDGIDPRLKQMAAGNYLYQFDGERFELVSVSGPQNSTSKTGWSWGGQFTDLENDGWLDLVVANGYYTAPPTVEGKIDL